MTRDRLTWSVVLVAGLVALGSSIVWAATWDRDDAWHMTRYGAGMMGYAASDGGEPVSDLGEARRQAASFAEALDLEVGEVMRFDNGFYAELEERDGRLATEVLVDDDTGAVWLEYGPAMMWNTRYGMASDGPANGMGGVVTGSMMGQGGMMGGASAAARTPDATAGTGDPVGAAEARRIAQRWLDANGEGRTAGEPDPFPGYYTLHVERDGRVVGMLSVNADTGALWYHWWHGRLLAMDG